MVSNGRLNNMRRNRVERRYTVANDSAICIQNLNCIIIIYYLTNGGTGDEYGCLYLEVNLTHLGRAEHDIT